MAGIPQVDGRLCSYERYLRVRLQRAQTCTSSRGGLQTSERCPGRD